MRLGPNGPATWFVMRPPLGVVLPAEALALALPIMLGHFVEAKFDEDQLLRASVGEASNSFSVHLKIIPTHISIDSRQLKLQICPLVQNILIVTNVRLN